MAIREKFRWVDPVSKKKYRVEVTRDFLHLLTNVIETDEQAEHFFEHYAKCCNNNEQAEYNIGYLAGLIKDKDVREDVLDLFMVDLQISPRQYFRREYALSTWVRSNG